MCLLPRRLPQHSSLCLVLCIYVIKSLLLFVSPFSQDRDGAKTWDVVTTGVWSLLLIPFFPLRVFIVSPALTRRTDYPSCSVHPVFEQPLAGCQGLGRNSAKMVLLSF